MTGYVLGRILQMIPLVIVLLALNFTLIHFAPGDPIVYLIGNVPADPDIVAALRHRLGLDLPFPEQLWRYMTGVIRGDLGTSFYFQRPVLDVVLERLPATLLLTVGQLLVTTCVGIPLGVLAALRRNSATDNLINGVAILGFSVPAFWAAQIAILIFAVELGVLPAQGMTDVRRGYEGAQEWLDIGSHLLLPVATLAFGHMALLIRITRTSVIETLTKEYVVVARAKGLTERVVTWRHAVRNSLLPIVTILGLELGTIVAGMIVVETVFAWPGIGRLTYDSIARRDYPVIMGVFLLSAVGVLLANLLTDVAYGGLNPRIRLGRGNR